MKYTTKILAAVFALTMVLSGCGSTGGENSAAPAPAPTEAVTAAPQETVTTTMSGNGIIFETEEPMETQAPVETVPETSSVTTTAAVPAVDIDLNAPEVVDFASSRTSNFCNKLAAGNYEMTFTIADATNGISASYTAAENEGLTYLKQEQGGTIIEYYIFSYAAYTITTQNGVRGDLMTMETNGVNMVESLVMFGLIDNARIVGVEDKHDGTVTEKAVFEVAGKTEAGEYTYDSTTGVLKNVRTGNSVLKMNSYKEGSDEIPIPVELGGTGTAETTAATQADPQAGTVEGGYAGEDYNGGYAQENYTYDGYTEEVYW